MGSHDPPADKPCCCLLKWWDDGELHDHTVTREKRLFSLIREAVLAGQRMQGAHSPLQRIPRASEMLKMEL